MLILLGGYTLLVRSLNYITDGTSDYIKKDYFCLGNSFVSKFLKEI